MSRVKRSIKKELSLAEREKGLKSSMQAAKLMLAACVAEWNEVERIKGTNRFLPTTWVKVNIAL